MERWSDELDLRAFAERFGSPLYIHHLPTLEARFARYLELVGDPGHVRYPIKANPSPTVVDRLAALGSGADCASRDEVRIAQAAGIPLRSITYNTPAPDLDLMVWLLGRGASVVADSFDVLDRLRRRLTPAEIAGALFVRVNPGELPGYLADSEIQKYTSHGSATSQFGIPSEEIPAYLEGYPLPVTGLHVHVGTQMDNLETFRQGMRFLHGLVDLLAAETPHRIATLNLGGGLGIPFLDGQEFPEVGELVEALEPLRRREIRYHVEPGNSLVGEAVALLATVVALKDARGRRWGILDVGTDQLVKFTVARWEHRVVDADHRPLPRSGPDALAGPLCFAGDVLLPETSLEGVRQGDPVLVQHAGAYCESISSRFNGRRGPAHVAIDRDGEPRLVQRREDPFFDPALQGALPDVLPPDGGDRISADHLASLQSRYMHELANDDRYRLSEGHKTGERTYRFQVDVRAAVDFVAMPLALRIIGDASIIAVGRELGRREKTAPVWATRLTMTCGGLLSADRSHPCWITVGHLYPSAQPGGGMTGVVHYRLGEHGEVHGTAKVVAME